jgi:hypothetical protein
MARNTYLGYLGTLITDIETDNYNEEAYLPDLACAVFTALVRHASCREHSNSVLPRGNGPSGEKSDFTVKAISRLISESSLCFTRAFVDRQKLLSRSRSYYPSDLDTIATIPLCTCPRVSPSTPAALIVGS